jgi:prepilin-type processing-associated H-X9-DG protein
VNTATQNHESGQNVLYVDGRVRWVTDNYALNDPNDNIFVEGTMSEPSPFVSPEKSLTRDFWNADTDSYRLREDTGLDRSFKGYPRLYYNRGERE